LEDVRPALGIGSNDSLCTKKLPQPSRTVLNPTMTKKPTQSRIVLITNAIKEIRSLNGDRHQYRRTISSSRDHVTFSVHRRYTQRHPYLTKSAVPSHLYSQQVRKPEPYLLEPRFLFELRTDRAKRRFLREGPRA